MDFAQSLRDLGFTYVSIDMSRAVHITAWRSSERKTYQVHGLTIEDAQEALLDSINAPAADEFEDLL